jgi:VWFA-related protein
MKSFRAAATLMNASRYWLVVCPFVVCVAQAPLAAPQESQPAPTFRSSVTLVRVSVVAKDKLGKPVADLRREDFQIFDHGLPQAIRLFLPESDHSNPASPEPRPHNTFTNQIGPTAGSHSGYSVILIDSIFTDWGDVRHPGAANARVSALRALQSIPAGERIAIYATTRKLQVICEFTSDRDLLEQQLQRWKASVDTIETNKAIFASPASAVLASSQAALAQQGAGREEDLPAAQAARIDAQQRVSSSNDDMDLVADHLAGVPGRKNLIWLSNRFVIGAQELRKFNAAGVAIYPVNIDGVTGNLDPLNQMLKSIAAQTGGVAFDMRNDVDVAIREAVDDGRIGYTLGFYQSNDDVPNPFEHLDVRVSRPGVTLRYYRTQAPRRAPAGTMADLVQALNQPIDATAIPINATVTRVEDSLNLKAVVDVESLELASSQGRWKGKIEIVGRFTAADGSPVGAVATQTLNLNLRQTPQGLGYRNDLKIPPKAVELRLLVANPDSGKIGMLTIPLSEVAAGGVAAK